MVLVHIPVKDILWLKNGIFIQIRLPERKGGKHFFWLKQGGGSKDLFQTNFS